MATLLRKVDSVECQELGRQTGRRSYPMDNISAQAGSREEMGSKKAVKRKNLGKTNRKSARKLTIVSVDCR